MILFRFFQVFFFLLISSTCFGLTLPEALILGASHPALLESALNIDQARSVAGDAGKRGPDTISLEAENFSGRFPGFSKAEITIAFKRPILDGKKANAQKRLAALSIYEAKLGLTILKRGILNRVQAAFHRVIGFQNLSRNAQEVSRINRDMFEATKARVEAGASPEQEIIKAQLDIDRVEVERKNLEGQLTEAILNLFREMGIKAASQVEVIGTLTPDIELPEFGILQEKISEAHPALLAIEQNLEENRSRFELLKAENRTSYNWAAGMRNFREDDNHGYLFAIEADLPNKIANRGARNAAQIEKTKVEAAKEKIFRELLTTLEEQINRFQRSKETTLSLRNQIQPNAQKTLEMALDGYRLGKTDQVVVLEARKAYAEVTRQSLTALSELYEAIDAIELLTGVCLVGEQH